MRLKNRVKNRASFPAYVLASCPACRSKELLRMEVDALCMRCDWDSARSYVDAGGMDNILSAYLDHCGLYLSETLDLKAGQLGFKHLRREADISAVQSIA